MRFLESAGLAARVALTTALITFAVGLLACWSLGIVRPGVELDQIPAPAPTVSATTVVVLGG